MLSPSWVRDNRDEFDVFHIQFGFDAQEPSRLAELARALRSGGKPLVYTIHDLRNPHHEDRRAHGHLAMAKCIAARLGDRVTGLSSLPCPPDWPGAWLRLARDDSGEPVGEPTARGQLRWAPLGHSGLRDRMAAIASWIQRTAPSVIVVSASPSK